MNKFIKISLFYSLTSVLYGGGEMQDSTWNNQWPEFKDEVKALYTNALNRAEATSVVTKTIQAKTAIYQGTIELLAQLMGA